MAPKCPANSQFSTRIDQLFSLAPQPPPCGSGTPFFPGNTSDAAAILMGAPESHCFILLRRNAPHFTSIASPKCGFRCSAVSKMWKQANLNRQLPPRVELFVYICDKPRGESSAQRAGFRFPTFGFVVNEAYSIGSGAPRVWQPPLPFPSYFQCDGCRKKKYCE